MNDAVEKRAVHSWSRLSSAGKMALEEALRVFNPMSKDLRDTETQLVTFLQGLREDGYRATILSSKDVYGYKSSTATPPKSPPKPAPEVSSSKPQTKTHHGKVSHPPVDISVRPTRVTPKPPQKKSSNLLLSSLKKTNLKKSKVAGVDFPSNVFPAMRLSVVLEAVVPIKEAASSLDSGLRPRSLLSKASQAYQCVLRPGPPPNGALPHGANGRILKENNACNTLVNGSPSSRHNGMTQTKPNAKPDDKRQQPAGKDKKRKQADAFQEAPPSKKIQIFIPLAKKPTLDKDKYDLLKSKVIKVDEASSDEDVRRKAQQILNVNLSPVLRIQPLLFNLQ